MKHLINGWMIVIFSILLSIFVHLISPMMAFVIISIFFVVQAIIIGIFTSLRERNQLIRQSRIYLAYIIIAISMFEYSIVTFSVMIFLLVVDIIILCNYKYF